MKRHMWCLAVLLVLCAYPVQLHGRQAPGPSGTQPPEAETRELIVQAGHNSPVQTLAYSPNHKLLASGGYDTAVRLWDVAKGRELRVMRPQNGTVTHVAFDPSGEVLLSVSSYGSTIIVNTLQLWDVATGKELLTFAAHDAVVTQIAFNPVGQLLATSSEDGTLQLWTIWKEQGSWHVKEQRQLRLPSGYIRSMKFSSDGRILAFAGSTGAIALVDVSSPESALTSDVLQPAASGALRADDSERTEILYVTSDREVVAAVVRDDTVAVWDAKTGIRRTLVTALNPRMLRRVVSSDGRLLATGALVERSNGAPVQAVIQVWDVTTGAEVGTFVARPEDTTMALAFSADGQLASGHFSGTIKLWDLNRRAEAHTLAPAAKRVFTVAYSADGQTITSGNQDGTITLWNGITGDGARELVGHRRAVVAMQFAPGNARLFASADTNGTVKLWNVDAGREIHAFTYAVAADASTFPLLAFSPDASILAVAASKEVTLWNTETGARVIGLSGHSADISAIRYSPTGSMVATGSRDGTAKVWDVPSGRELRTLVGGEYRIFSLAFSDDGRQLLTSSVNDAGTASVERRWDVSTGTQLRELTSAQVLNSDGASTTISGDRRVTASRGGHDTVAIFDSAGARVRVIPAPAKLVGALALSSDGHLLASGVADHTISLWDVVTGRELRRLSGNSHPVQDVRFDPDGRVLAAVTGDHGIRLWDVSTGKQRGVLVGHTSDINYIRFSPNGGVLASWGDDHVIRLWNVAAGTTTHALDVEYTRAAHFCFDPSGRRFAATNGDGTVRVWDVASGAVLRTFPIESMPQADAQVTFNADGTLLASGSTDHTVHVWRVATGRLRRILRGHGGPVNVLAFSPTRPELLISGSDDGTVKLWNVRTGRTERTFGRHDEGVVAVAWTPDGRTFDTVDGTYTRRVWQRTAGTRISESTLVDARQHLSSRAEMPLSERALHRTSNIGPESADGRLMARATPDRLELWDQGAGKLLGSLFALGAEDWAVVTPDGLFDGTDAAMQRVSWRLGPETTAVAPLDLFFNDYYRPGLLAELMAGERPRAPVDIVTELQLPGVRTLLAEGQARIEQRDGQAVLCVRDAPTAAPPLFRDGQPFTVVANSREYHRDDVVCPYRYPLPPSRQYAVTSAPRPVARTMAWTGARGATSATAQATLHVLTVGVGAYGSGSGFDPLTGSVAGARAVEEFFAAQQRAGTTPFGAIRVWDGLYDAAATREGIRRRLAEMAAAVQEDDVVWLLLAGHGVVPAGQELFYFAPIDMRGPNPEDQRESGLNTAMLATALRALRARRVVVIIDACQSGGAIESLGKIGEVKAQVEQRRAARGGAGGAAAAPVGVYVVAAATPLQQAAAVGSGPSLLVQTLLAALGRGTPGPVSIRDVVAEVARELPRVSARAQQPQTPMVVTLGVDFPIAARGPLTKTPR